MKQPGIKLGRYRIGKQVQTGPANGVRVGETKTARAKRVARDYRRKRKAK